MSRLLLVATWLLVVWGALAFGAVYPWAWRPLITGCAVVGAACSLFARRYGARAHDRAVLVSLGCVALTVALQMTPIPRGARLWVSPSSETVLLEQDLEYAMAARLTGVVDDGSSAQVPAALPERTLSINPDATARALVLLVGLTLLLCRPDPTAQHHRRAAPGWLDCRLWNCPGPVWHHPIRRVGRSRVWRHAHLRLLAADEPAHDAIRAVRQQESLRRLDVDGPAAGDGARPRVGRARAAERESGLAPRPALAFFARGRKTATGRRWPPWSWASRS